MKITGFHRASLFECPGKISAIVFTSGCNMNCYYCHYKPTCLTDTNTDIYDFITYIQRRILYLDAIVISGGEPTIQDGLIDFIMYIKSLGYFVKLVTNGTKPDVISELLEKKIIDSIDLNIKAPLGAYSKIKGCEGWDLQVINSVQIIKESDIPHQFRITVVPELTFSDLILIEKQLKEPVVRQFLNVCV